MGYFTLEEHGFISIFCSACGEPHRVLRKCRQRFCPICSRGRGARVRLALDSLFKQTKLRPGFSFYHLTLSTPNCLDLRRGVKHLIKSFRRLRSRRFWSRLCAGGAFVIEVTGSSDNWHPHLHIIIVSRFIPWKLLLREWQKCSGGRGVFIRRIDRFQAQNYITKYITKPAVPDVDADLVNDVLSGTRLFTRFGVWAQLKLPPFMSQMKCDKCSNISWISEFEILKLSKGS